MRALSKVASEDALKFDDEATEKWTVIVKSRVSFELLAQIKLSLFFGIHAIVD